MKKYLFALALLALGSTASAGLYNYIWMVGPNGAGACYPVNLSGQVAQAAAAVPSQFCQYAYAWQDTGGMITCMAVTSGGMFFPGATAVAEANCARSFIFGADAYGGGVQCFGQGPDGNIVPGIPPVAAQYCNTP